jgi:hypothetical protein
MDLATARSTEVKRKPGNAGYYITKVYRHKETHLVGWVDMHRADPLYTYVAADMRRVPIDTIPARYAPVVETIAKAQLGDKYMGLAPMKK